MSIVETCDETDRSLATIRRIAKIEPIPGADNIEVATVGGWKVVVKKGEFQSGQLATYLEIDSWVPDVIAPFLSKGKIPGQFNGVSGSRLKTVRLRGQVSQGLLLPAIDGATEGEDVTRGLGVQKWEMPVPACMRGKMAGLRPEFIRKTDQERIQNIDAERFGVFTERWHVTTKLDGSSMTVYRHNGKCGVCSRNVELRLDQEGNVFVDTAKAVFGKDLENVPEGFAFQGELMGPGIQGNREGFLSPRFFAYGVWLTRQRAMLPPMLSHKLCSWTHVEHVPEVLVDLLLPEIGVKTVDEIIALADGPSIANRVREGLVFVSMDGSKSFKVVSNKYLLETES